MAADVINSADVGAGDFARKPDLIVEPVEGNLGQGNPSKNLQGNIVAEFHIPNTIDIGHATSTQQTYKSEPIRDEAAG
jgi:hypothetical protein